MAAFFLIYHRFGYEPLALTTLPLIVGGLLFGVRGGVVAWLLAIPLTAILHASIGLGPNLFVHEEGPVRLLAALAVGVVVGRLRDLGQELSAEALRREAIEARLG